MPYIHYHYQEFVHVLNHYCRDLCQNYHPVNNTKNIIMLWIHASEKTEKSDFGSHAKMMSNSKTSTEACRLTVWNEAVDEACEMDFRSIAARKASCDGRCLEDKRPLWANSALLRFAETSSNEWNGIALSNSSFAALLEAVSMIPSGSEDSDMSPTSNRFGITYDF